MAEVTYVATMRVERGSASWIGKGTSVFAGAALVVFAMVGATNAQGPGGRVSIVSDWSHRHVVFSRPSSLERAWALQAEPRYRLQVLSRSARRHRRVDDESGGERNDLDEIERSHKESRKAFQTDWGQSLGANGSTGVPLAGVAWYPVFPAKYTFDINANPDCNNDYVIFPTNLAGATAGQASVIAYRNLYAGAGSSFCGVANPTVYWSYNTNFDNAGAATNGTVQTSPVISSDGTKVAFVETRAAGGAILHLLKWHALDGGAINTAAAPTIATVWTADGVTGHCPVAGACMINIVLNGAAQPDTASSPFYDYARDVIYVGDDGGVLHKIINAFGVVGATPSEMTTGNWPITVDAGKILTSPTFDSVSGNIFTGDAGGRLSYVRETFSTAGTCAAGSPPCLGSTNINLSVLAIADAPIVDSTTGKVFVFSGNIGPNAAVIQSDVTLSASVTASLGTATSHRLHSGAFDNTYLTGDGSVGSLYMCGSSAPSAPTIQRIGFTNSGRVPASPFANPVGTTNAAVDAATLTVATGGAECAPVTELYNANAPAASRDQIFFGVQNLGTVANCGGAGCVMSVNVTGTPGTLAIANSIPEINGPSGIIVDNDANIATFPQSSSLYFSRQGNSTASFPCGGTVGVGCAVKVTQAGLN
jgi:hypothetical protein